MSDDQGPASAGGSSHPPETLAGGGRIGVAACPPINCRRNAGKVRTVKVRAPEQNRRNSRGPEWPDPARRSVQHALGLRNVGRVQQRRCLAGSRMALRILTAERLRASGLAKMSTAQERIRRHADPGYSSANNRERDCRGRVVRGRRDGGCHAGKPLRLCSEGGVALQGRAPEGTHQA